MVPTSAGFQIPILIPHVKQALQVLPDEPEYTLHQQAQVTFASSLPAIPLYERLKVAATRDDFCGFDT